MKPNDEYGCEDAEHRRRHRLAVRNEKNKDEKKSWRNHITKLGYTAYITAKLNTVQLNKEKNCFHQIKSNTSCGKNSKSEHKKRSENSCQKKKKKKMKRK